MRSAEEREHEFFETPAWCVHRLLDELGLDFVAANKRWLEPCVGNGAIICAVDGWARRYSVPHREWTAFDIRPTGVGTQRDFLHDQTAQADICIMNPPFKLASEFLVVALQCAKRVFMLQRLSWMRARSELLRGRGMDVYVLPERPDFTGGGGDNQEYCWYSFDRNHWPRESLRRGTIHFLDATPLDERRRHNPVPSKRKRATQERISW